MKLEKPVNSNYCATVAKVSNIVVLENCDNVHAAIVLGYQVIVDKSIKVGDIGIFFPVEVKLSSDYLKNNNLYADKTKNNNTDKKGYFHDNGRLRCVKFRNNKSEGLFMPLSTLNFITDISTMQIGDEFDTLCGKVVCSKYTVEKKQNQVSSKSDKRNKKITKVSKLIDNQFRLHIDTAQLKKNMSKITPDTIISCTSKWHGTSFVSSNVLVKKQLGLKDKVAKLLGVNVQDTEYGNVYSSRNVVKNEYFEKQTSGYYEKNVWMEENENIKDVIPKGFSIYGEIVGYVAPNSFIQKGYHYGCENGKHELYVYRITYTNVDGKVYELTRPEIDTWCKSVGIKTTPLYFYGYAKDMYKDLIVDSDWNSNFLKKLESDSSIGMNDTMCKYNNNEVPSEGIVIRIENMLNMEPLKLKNYRFLQRETELLDKDVSDMESEN